MKRMLLAAFSALCFSATAQITVTSATFPVAGDTLHFAIDNNPAGINPATPPGGNQAWDFTGLHKSQVQNVAYQPASSGADAASFPGAETVVNNGLGETYYNLTPNKMEALGYAGADPIGFGVNISAHYQPALIERRSPMNYFDINQQSSNVGLTFPTDQPPFDSLFANLPVNVDSLRIRLNTQRSETVDGWGSCKIPGGSYNVLRQKRIEYRSPQVDVYVALFPGFGTWVDLSTVIGTGGGGLSQFLKNDTITTYRFYSSTDKEEIAVATMANDLSSTSTVRFKNNATTTPTHELSPVSNASISAFPNPAVEWVRFDCTNLPPDEYTLKIFNIIGKVVWKETYQLSGSRSIRLDLDNFKKGTYLYSMTDKQGNIIGTKRLVVLKP